MKIVIRERNKLLTKYKNMLHFVTDAVKKEKSFIKHVHKIYNAKCLWNTLRHFNKTKKGLQKNK